MNGFRNFLLRGNLVELAVAVVIGAAFNGLVNDFVKSFIAPLLALFGGRPDFTKLAFTINGTTFPFGVFMTSAVSFLIVASIIYFCVVLPVTKILERIARNETATERDCPRCLSSIPLAASRCKYCTSEISPGQIPEQTSRG
jgi:large conductance mechanosensitive channel